MKKAIAWASLLLVSSSLLVGCNQNAAPNNQGQTGGTAGTQSVNQNQDTLSMTPHQSLQARVSQIVGKDANVFVAGDNAFVVIGTGNTQSGTSGGSQNATDTKKGTSSRSGGRQTNMVGVDQVDLAGGTLVNPGGGYYGSHVRRAQSQANQVNVIGSHPGNGVTGTGAVTSGANGRGLIGTQSVSGSIPTDVKTRIENNIKQANPRIAHVYFITK